MKKTVTGGFRIVTNIDRVPTDLVERYRPIAPSTLGHLIDGHAVDGKVLPLLPGMSVLGPAVTVATHGRDSTVCHKVMDVIRPGDVIVVATGDVSYACWGEMMTLAAKVQGAAGVVVDGPLTDVAQLLEIGLPVFGKGRAALTTQLLGEGGSINQPIVCGGLRVDPGDLVLGSADGVLVVPKVEARELLEAAQKEETADGEWRDALLGGKRPSELYDLDGLIAGTRSPV